MKHRVCCCTASQVWFECAVLPPASVAGCMADYKAAGGGAAAGAAGDADEGDGDDAGDEEAAE